MEGLSVEGLHQGFDNQRGHTAHDHQTRRCDRQSTHRYPEVILYGTHCSARECSGRGASLAWRSLRVSSMHLCAQHSYSEETAEHKVTSESEYKLWTSSTICSACSLFSVTALAPGSSGCSCALALPDSRWRIMYRCICIQQRIKACICNVGAGELFATTMRRIAATIQNATHCISPKVADAQQKQCKRTNARYLYQI